MAISGRLLESSKAGVSRLIHLYHPRTWKEKGLLWTSGLVIVTYLVVVLVLGMLWSREPDAFDVRGNALELAQGDEKKLVPGYVTTATVIGIGQTLLDKPGGYLSNDITPPGLYLDNIPAWEFGVLTALRDVTRGMRNDFSRSQSQSAEDKDLVIAQPQFNYDSESWVLPSSESEYRKGLEALTRYLNRLTDDNPRDGQFYTRADNLRNYLFEVEQRLGSLAQRLGASVGRISYDTTLAGDPKAAQAKPGPEQFLIKTPWLEIDDVFYEARGYTWALLHILDALESDFAPVLNDKNAMVSLKQIIRELEGAQEPLWAPMVLNGQGFALVANHSLVMASYISRANAALIDLRSLLERG
ncbi:MAG TPA: DUF2333 family protein [Candidatus Competibacteraceae bacterium]|nr:DUF2333 family protein [Candidatus Competibacteraceae bacterium]